MTTSGLSLLGSGLTITDETSGEATDITVGVTTITGGTTGRVLYDNAGLLGEYTITGTAGSVVLSVTPTFTGFPSFTAAGTVITATLATPGAPTVVAVGANNAGATYHYDVVAFGSGSTASSTDVAFAGNSPLDSSHKNQVTPPTVTGATLFGVYRFTAAGGKNKAFIGYCLPGGSVLDDGSVAPSLDILYQPNIDTGSSGPAFKSPLTVTGVTAYNDQTSQGYTMGNAQFGGLPVIPPPVHTSSAGLGFNVVMTGKVNSSTLAPVGGYNTLLLWDIGAASTIAFRGNDGTYGTPISNGGTFGHLIGDNWVTSWQLGFGQFQTSAKIDFGGNPTDSSNVFANDHDVFGYVGLGVAAGEWGGISLTGRDYGAAVASRKGYLGNAVWNTTNVTGSNDTGLAIYHRGYSYLSATPDIATSYEAFFAGWKPVRNAITAMSWANTGGGQTTIQLTDAHAMTAGQHVAVTGSTGSIYADGYNGNWLVISDNGTNLVVKAQGFDPGTASPLGTATYGGNAFYLGPVAAVGGTLWPMYLTGADIVVNGSGAALATTATDGFLYIPTCSGTPTGTPTTFTGRIAMIYDTSAHQFWFYDGGWKQPKTPAAAAIITWQ